MNLVRSRFKIKMVAASIIFLLQICPPLLSPVSFKSFFNLEKKDEPKRTPQEFFKNYMRLWGENQAYDIAQQLAARLIDPYTYKGPICFFDDQSQNINHKFLFNEKSKNVIFSYFKRKVHDDLKYTLKNFRKNNQTSCNQRFKNISAISSGPIAAYVTNKILTFYKKKIQTPKQRFLLGHLKLIFDLTPSRKNAANTLILQEALNLSDDAMKKVIKTGKFKMALQKIRKFQKKPNIDTLQDLLESTLDLYNYCNEGKPQNKNMIMDSAQLLSGIIDFYQLLLLTYSLVF